MITYFFPVTSYFFHVTSYFFHITSYFFLQLHATTYKFIVMHTQQLWSYMELHICKYAKVCSYMYSYAFTCSSFKSMYFIWNCILQICNCMEFDITYMQSYGISTNFFKTSGKNVEFGLREFSLQSCLRMGTM